MSTIIFIDYRVPQLNILLNSLIVPNYDFNLRDQINPRKQIDLTNITRIGFLWENNYTMFPFGKTNYILSNGKPSCFFSDELIQFFKTINNYTEIDLITCELKSQDFKDELELIYQQVPNIKFNYSVNLTGNPPFGDWIMESSGIDIAPIYFNSNIENFTSVLAANISAFPSGMVLWFDASDPNNNGTTPSNGSLITTWYDKSGGGRNANANEGITYNTTGLGSKYPALTFTSSARRWLTGSVPITGNQATVLGVMSFDSESGAWARLISFSNGNGTNDYNNTSYFTFTRINNGIGFGPTRNGTAISNNTPIYSKPYLFETWFDGTNSYNTVQIGNSTTITSMTSTGDFNISYFAIGSNTNTDDIQVLSGSISEIFVFNRALTNTERQMMEGYMSWKWGLQSNLPTTHPYKLFKITYSLNLSNYDLSNTDLSGINLSGTNLSGSNLTGVNLTNGDLSGTDLSGTDLSGTDLSGANLFNAKLWPIKNKPSRLPNNNYKQFGDKILGPNLNLKQINLSNTDISNIILTGSNLESSILSNTNLSNANLSNSNLSNAITGPLVNFPLTLPNSNYSVVRQSSKITTSYILGPDISMQNVNLSKWYWHKQDLSSTYFAPTTNLSFNSFTFINFKNMNMSNNSINTCTFTKCTFINVNMTNTKFISCVFNQCVFDAQIPSTNLIKCKIYKCVGL